MVTIYDRSFYEHQAARSLQSARTVLGKLFPLIQPRRVIDIGCGVGPWAKIALDLGATDVFGVDGAYVDQSLLMIPPARFRSADIEIDSLTTVLADKLTEPFDLVISLETAEHLHYARAESFVAELTALGDLVLFGAAAPFQSGTHHVNEQWPEFWAILFRAQGYECWDWLRSELWTDRNVDWWYAQNTLIFAKSGSAAAALLPEAAKVGGRSLAIVHPENFLSNLLGNPRVHRAAALGEELHDFYEVTQADKQQARALPILATVARAAIAGPAARDVFPWTRTKTFEPERQIEAEKEKYVALEEMARDEIRRRELAESQTAAIALQKKEDEAMLIQLRQELENDKGAIARLRLEAENQERVVTEFRQKLEKDEGTIARLRQKLRQDQGVIARLQLHLTQERARIFSLTTACDSATYALATTKTQLNALHGSTVWKASGPFRHVLSKTPPSMRRLVRGTMKLVWWSATLKLSAKLKARREKAVADDIPRLATTFAEFQPAVMVRAEERLLRFGPFEARHYSAMHRDVSASGISAAEHVVRFGGPEARKLFRDEAVARAIGSLAGLPVEPAVKAKFPNRAALQVPIGIYCNSHGNIFMKEIAEDFVSDLRETGVKVQLLDETAPMEARPPVCLFIAPHEFFSIGRGRKWLREDIVTQSFMLNTEQVQTGWFALALPFLLTARGVVDICSQSALLLAEAGVEAVTMQHSLLHHPEGLRETDRDHPLFKVLPPTAKRLADPASVWEERPLDLNFFGATSPYRERFFARHAARFAEYEAFLYCRRSRTPLSAGGKDGGLTRLAAHVAAHSKISLNIHRDEFGYFEWHRIVKLGLYAGSVVVSDPCLPHPAFIAGTHYFEENPRYIPDLVDWLLKTRDGRDAARAVRANAEALFRNPPPLRETLAPVARMLWRDYE